MAAILRPARVHISNFQPILAAKCKTARLLVKLFLRCACGSGNTNTRRAASATDGCCKRCMCVRPAAQWACLSGHSAQSALCEYWMREHFMPAARIMLSTVISACVSSHKHDLWSQTCGFPSQMWRQPSNLENSLVQLQVQKVCFWFTRGFQVSDLGY